MSVLEWLLILELLLLLSAGVCYVAGRITSRRGGEEDPLYRTFARFWEVFLTPQPARYAIPDVLGEWLEEQKAAAGEAEAAEALEGIEGIGPGHPDRRAAAPGSGRGGEGAEGEDRVTTLAIRVVPSSGRSEILGRAGDEIDVELPLKDELEHGPANKALIELLSQRLGVKAYQIQLVRGHYRSMKTIRVTGIEQSEAEGKLGELI